MTSAQARKKLQQYASPSKAAVLRRFFKTGPGQYGQGDIFIGVKVPEIRAVAQQCQGLAVKETLRLLCSPIHEERLLALIILISQYQSENPPAQENIVKLYLKNTRYTNNWDLIDISAPKIIGHWLRNKDKKLLYALARSKNLWERRIAIVATFTFIREGQLKDTFAIADMLLRDHEDLMHKATGWMLREAGKKDLEALKAFLRPRQSIMPRTMLRYAIERFPKEERKKYLQK